MNSKQTICLLNDSFPPQIDGVANAVLNYAEEIEKSGSHAMVVTPSYPDSKDEIYTYPIVRYPSVNFKKMDAYRAGFPFSPRVADAVQKNNVALLHSHCPIVSTFMARELRQVIKVPIILTYHSKFDLDIQNIIKDERLQAKCKKALVENINACDEVWVVSNGAGENLRSLGYKGDYIVMPNGVDFARGRASEEKIATVTGTYDLPFNVPVYLFVGRMMWYKGIRIILDSLVKLSGQNKDFRMVFVGDGDDKHEIEQYALQLGLTDKCIFTGAIHDREVLRAWYCRANLFLFPSTYDTNGLVVREAAACDLASVLIKNSCAAEGVTDGRNGFLIDETADALYSCLLTLYERYDKILSVGKCAGEELYISWESSVKKAMERYKIVCNTYQSKSSVRRRIKGESFFKLNGNLMKALASLSGKRKDD